jgi:hypothetical protein
MKKTTTTIPVSSPPSRNALAALLKCALAMGVAGIAGCGPGDKPPAGSAPGGSASDGGRPDAKAAASSPKKPAPVVVDPKPINLKKISTFEGGEMTGRSAANATYKVKGEVKPVYEFHKKQFIDLGWKEGADSVVTDQSASGSFSGAGYTISLMVYSAGTPGSVDVMLHNHGNVALAKLPLPPGTKPVYVGAISSMHVTEASVPETTEAVRKLLTDAGWEPHGNEGDSWHYKQGLNRVSAMISSAPAQGGKTMINYSSELMAGDLPAPADARDLRYVDTQELVTFDTAADKDAVAAYYKQALGKSGWKPNREETYRIDDKDEMVFRNGDGIIFLEMRPGSDGGSKVSLSSTTMTEMDEASARIKAKLAAEKKAKEEEAAKHPTAAKPKVSVAVPAGATGVEQSASGLKITVGNGKAKGVAQTWRKQFGDAGWKEGAASLDAMAGMISLSKDDASLTITYTDTGFTPAEVSVSGIGVEIGRSE